MSLSLNEHKVQLINKILAASSQAEVQNHSDRAIKTLERKRVDECMIDDFVDKLISELDSFNPMNKDAQQWSNISMAKIIFKRYKNKHHKLAK
jgi:hypothetical protein